ncbi:MAG TPA: hypothetical protein DEF41_05565 [Desulfovibrio sp.]|uniref:Uncharacterized protein n=1 Tax=Nitratidesulfovibrio vulgaris (strain ATCC 29579 / DSM 644 / CCUG 34227 / NCIMB 8303 / VKM B-1760 / Hildenborough) TaxID=882 RepID=Q728F2_NITV2|nr:hypothetical protein DVU_2651 [Nitratidesulfovibrio vulgaris str. Hildenborough]HBW15596.1 hypothetical protein [Desulfovibrio sp.]
MQHVISGYPPCIGDLSLVAKRRGGNGKGGFDRLDQFFHNYVRNQCWVLRKIDFLLQSC